MKQLWQSLKKPIFVLAPMEDVTDTVFRRIVCSCGRPDVLFTEFTSTEGMCSAGYKEVGKRLVFTEDERPLIAQIWGEKPEFFKQATQMLVKMGFDGIDINMGCPEKSVLKKGACSALIKNHKLASEIIKAVQSEAGDLPVSVKTRIGFESIMTEEWIGFLLTHDLDALTIHARTVKEMSEVPAHWEEVKKAVEIRDRMDKKTVVIGNGDISSREEALMRIKETGADGVMIGRGIFKDPWIFNPNHHGDHVTFDEKVIKLKEHMMLFENEWGERKSYAILKKFVKCYITGVPHASEVRVKLMETKKYAEAYEVLDSLISS